MDNDTPAPADNVSTQSLLDTSAPDTTDTSTTDTSTDTTTDTSTDTTDNTDSSFEAVLAGFSDDLKDSDSLKQFKSVEDLAKSFVEQKKLVGRKTAIPGDEATAEEWAEFYNNAGRPEGADKYGIEIPAEFADIPGASDKANAAFEAAHEAGLSKKQAETLFGKLFEGEVSEMTNQKAAAEKQYADSKDALFEAWGTGEKFEAEVRKVTAFQKKAGFYEDFEAAGLNSNPTLLIALSKIANSIGADSSIDTMHDSSTVDSSSLAALQKSLTAAIKSGDTDEARNIQARLRNI